MERLVIQNKAGSLCYNDTDEGLKLEPNEITSHQRRLLLERLHMYESIGLTPEQIQKLKTRDMTKTPEAAEEQRYFRKHFRTMVCPVCHKKIESRSNFCSHCGQRLTLRD